MSPPRSGWRRSAPGEKYSVGAGFLIERPRLVAPVVALLLPITGAGEGEPAEVPAGFWTLRDERGLAHIGVEAETPRAGVDDDGLAVAQLAA